LTGYADVASQLRDRICYRSLAVLINGWDDVEGRIAYRASAEIPATGPRWTLAELNSFIEHSGAGRSTSVTVVERAKAVWAITPIGNTWTVPPMGDIRQPAGYLLIDRAPENSFSESDFRELQSAANAMTPHVVEAEMHSAREMLVLERKLMLQVSERVIEASEAHGWEESAHQELQSAFDALTDQKVELEEAYRWSTVAEREIQQAFNELKVANEAKTRFLATVSHELKTPLTSISAFTDIIKKNRAGNLGERELKQLNVISRNVHRLNLLINDLLDLTRIDAGTLVLENDDFQVSDLLRDMSAMFDPILSRRNQRLTVQDGSSGRWLTGDRDRLEQVVTNLVTNASKFSPEGSAVEMNVDVGEGQLHLAVTDSGVGIPEESQAQIFDAFFRVENEETRSVSGTGVGLYITASVVRLHGGEISVESRFGEGTTIRASLPGVIDGPSEEHLMREASRIEALDDHRSRLDEEHREAA
jgi:signal transduction histidine kinase